eukprot:CAMPEP_0183368740 /NCGR_PEP_ID=MMETSP0164_2-20130417/96989_1 /TAXON_ID=221442 /ORGANISM="Coccolithus pelagicus ssp braarudi, Strain PLY182g" /LENGTH=73 /DNA_ID=CAMNT_0025544881 /DNA_START=62 /DNA_END=283 /DNA_ORIENTATION=+
MAQAQVHASSLLMALQPEYSEVMKCVLEPHEAPMSCLVQFESDSVSANIRSKPAGPTEDTSHPLSSTSKAAAP